MSYLALYRKYRPDTFDKLIGQEPVVRTLVNQIENDRLGHAYLFTGTRGTGKTSAAKIFAKAINCKNPKNGSPCGECECCKALSDPSNIDVIEIDAASNNGVNEIRNLREKVQYPPVSCKYKVYIIDEVHMLTGAAFNALLKTLEEPPKHAVFILATTEAHKIPATILSRCMRFDFRLISTEEIASLIGGIYKELGKEYDYEAVYAIAAAGEGSVRDALSIADTALSYGKGKLVYEDVMEILGSSNFELITEFVTDVIVGNSGAVMQTIDKLSSLGKSIGVLIKDVSSTIRNLLIIKTCDDAAKILSLPQNKYDQLKKIADLTDSERLIRMLEVFTETENSVKYTTHPRIIFETAAMKLTKPETDYNIDALLSRISQLEKKLEEGVTVKLAEAAESARPINAVSASTVKEEPVKPVTTVNVNKPSIFETSDNELKGKLLFGLREVGREMLWNLFQTVDVSAKGNILHLTAHNSGDDKILDNENNKRLFKEILSGYADFTIAVDVAEENKGIEEIDDETEKIKKIFGENIVIIK